MGGSIFLLMQVIWAIGASMLALAALQYLGRRVCLVVGLAIVVSHNLLDRYWVANALLEQRPLWVALHAQMSFHFGPFQLAFVYPILAWIGVMLVGFGVSEVFEFVIIALYPFCRWVAAVKARRRDWWLSYV
jgi:uncharacterized membrane protein